MAFALRSASSGISLQRSASSVRKAAPVSRRSAVAVRAGQAFDSQWIKKDPLVLGASLAGWLIPSNIPVSGYGGASLFSLFTTSISEELAHWPTGPALTDKFWLYMITWHVGLFACMMLGQIGVQGKRQGYF